VASSRQASLLRAVPNGANPAEAASGHARTGQKSAPTATPPHRPAASAAHATALGAAAAAAQSISKSASAAPQLPTPELRRDPTSTPESDTGKTDTTQPGQTSSGGGDDDIPTGRRTARRRAAGPARRRFAANDDSPSIGGLVYALNQKPSNRPFQIAALISALWLGVGLAFAYIILAPDIAATRGNVVEMIRTSNVLATIATLVGPVLLFWFLAFLIWRSEELRLRSSAMTEVAVRLAEPDRIAEQQVASLGDAVRRQVNYMNEAVTMALGRAGELESMVQGEVSALERSYEENERKISNLLQELARERNSLTGTGDHFRTTLEQLASDVPRLIERLGEQQGRLAHIIASAGDHLTSLETSIGSDRIHGRARPDAWQPH